ncbi:MAG: potassium transporter [Deferribacteres bacterium]|nr:potassium transporter [candidate division KSB1 bacterium]MCB9501758.1 potassium transporter [Deferribacteres bacterium]
MLDKILDKNQDLGFGTTVSQQSRARLLNRDGSFNVTRTGLPFAKFLNTYHTLIAMHWGIFHITLIVAYLGINLLFAALYMLAGHEALSGIHSVSLPGRFLEIFFFSVQTFTTVGYGHITPVTTLANLIATAESFAGLLGFALATGLLFARFSRPTAEILFSENALVSPYKGITGLMFRISNARRNQLVDLSVRLILSRFEVDAHGNRKRQFHNLELERDQVAFFPLTWTIVHPINETSPLQGLNATDVAESEAEVLILLSAFDETFSTTVHTRSSYQWDEIVWGKKFVNLFELGKNGEMSVDVRKLGDWE